MGVDLKPPSCRGRVTTTETRGAPRCSKCTTVVTLSSRVFRLHNCPHFELPAFHRPPLKCSKCVTVVILSSLMGVDLKPPSRRARVTPRGARGTPRCSKCTTVVTLSSRALRVRNCLHFELSKEGGSSASVESRPREFAVHPRRSEVLKLCNRRHFGLSNGGGS